MKICHELPDGYEIVDVVFSEEVENINFVTSFKNRFVNYFGGENKEAEEKIKNLASIAKDILFERGREMSCDVLLEPKFSAQVQKIGGEEHYIIFGQAYVCKKIEGEKNG